MKPNKHYSRMPAARAFVRQTLLLLNQAAPPDVVDDVAEKICEQLEFLDKWVEPRYDCGYAGCELITTVPHGHN